MEDIHKPSHRLILLRRDWLLRNKTKEIKKATEALLRGERTFETEEMVGNSNGSGIASSGCVSESTNGAMTTSNGLHTVETKESTSEKVLCAICKSDLKRPCWFCVDCSSNVPSAIRFPPIAH